MSGEDEAWVMDVRRVDPDGPVLDNGHAPDCVGAWPDDVVMFYGPGPAAGPCGHPTHLKEQKKALKKELKEISGVVAGMRAQVDRMRSAGRLTPEMSQAVLALEATLDQTEAYVRNRRAGAENIGNLSTTLYALEAAMDGVEAAVVDHVNDLPDIP